MRSRDVVGKRIVAVRQRRAYDSNRAPITDVQALVFEDGTELRFNVAERESDYAVDAYLVRAPKVQ